MNHLHRPRHPTQMRIAGFTLLEVLIAMVITAVGLLGLAKMQALAIVMSKNTGTRSLIALQAESLAAIMHTNGTFWAKGAAPATVTAAGRTVGDTTGVLSSGVAGGCLTECTPVEMAANDLQEWVENMDAQFPGYAAKIDCPTTMPINCSLYITWKEKTVAVNKTTATGAAQQISTQSFSVYVKP